MAHPYRTAPPPKLEPPPRRVPFGLRMQILFDGLGRRIAWGAVGVFSVILFWLAPQVHWSPREYSKTADGEVIDVDRQTDEDGDVTGYRVDAEFVDDAGRRRTVTSDSDEDPNVGEHVIVEYGSKGARIYGMEDQTQHPILAGLLIVLALGAGAFVFWGYRGAQRDLRLIRHGKHTRATLIHKDVKQADEDSNPILWTLIFEFELPGGKKQRITIVTSNNAPLEDDEAEPLVYDPKHPEEATTLDHLPGSPRIDKDGRVHARDRAIFIVVVPTLVIALFVAAIARLFLP